MPGRVYIYWLWNCNVCVFFLYVHTNHSVVGKVTTLQRALTILIINSASACTWFPGSMLCKEVLRLQGTTPFLAMYI